MLVRAALSGVLAVLFSMPWSPPSWAQDSDPARRLILAMSADETAAIETSLGFRLLGEQGQITQKQAQCMQKVDRTAFTDVFARTVTEKLTPEEIRAATEFYESEVGRKFAQVRIAEAYLQSNVVPPAPGPELSDAEKAAITAFVDSPAGTKLLKEAVLTDSDSGRRAARDRILELQARCST